MKPIALDAMGGDHMPQAALEGALNANLAGIPVILVGDEARLKDELSRLNQKHSLSIHHASDVIGMHDHASDVRRRKDSSIMKAMQLVKDGEASACVSMGHSGATMAAALFVLGRIKGVDRPAILANIPLMDGLTGLIDAGANADCRPEFLQQFAIMGSIYAKAFYHKENPTIGLMSIGEEDEKGNELSLSAFKLLKQTPNINFYGNVEGRDLFKGTTDIIVTDGFTGNVMLKLAEGEAKMIFGWIKTGIAKASPLAKLGALLLKPMFKGIADKLDPSEYGAQPLLGVKGYAFIGHGSADARAVTNALKTAKKAVEAGLVEEIMAGLAMLNPETLSAS
ncbi:MAG: phosphate acyltransferase PlsX [Deinococcales bacterium]